MPKDIYLIMIQIMIEFTTMNCGFNLQALEESKLFILDCHDMFLPFIKQINTLDDQKAYGTIAIELSLPPTKSGSASKQVLTPPVDATTNWLWQLGKAHVCSNDVGAHQLIIIGYAFMHAWNHL
ncbi:hypothetical protein ACFX1Q_036712 [Malus domestica]